MYYYGLDWTYILVIIGAVITLAAQAKMKAAFSKYSKVGSSSGMTGAEAARRILGANGVFGVSVQQTAGSLTDHYNSSDKTVNLSEDVYDRTDLAAIGVAAHECGHAIQDYEEYFPLKARNALVPVANFGARFSWIVIFAGILLSGLDFPLLKIGILLFALTVLLQLVTLPVEINASERAMRQLTELGIITDGEAGASRKVLKAAALTYVAGAAAGILQLLRLILLFGDRGRRRD